MGWEAGWSSEPIRTTWSEDNLGPFRIRKSLSLAVNGNAVLQSAAHLYHIPNGLSCLQ
jgi:hypothetical protein